MRRKNLALLLAIALILPLVSGAAALPFLQDVQAINQAAGSVLMLQVYSNKAADYIASGSGFVAFDSHSLITNYHVIEGGDLIHAESDEGQVLFLDRVLAFDKEKDLAILRFKGDSGLLPLELDGDSPRLRGQGVVAIGSPEGYRNTVSKGDISSIFSEDQVRYIQFTAPISKGSSGGALFSDQGRVIGITSASLRGGGSQNMNFAIDIREAMALYEAAKDGEAISLQQMDGRFGLKTQEPPSPSQGQGISADSKAITLRWDAVPGAIGYKVYRATTREGHFFLQGESEPSSLVYVDSKVLPGRLYYYQVEPLLQGGQGQRLDFPAIQLQAEGSIPPPPQPALSIGASAYLGNLLDPYIDPDVVNTGSQAVSGFTLAFYCEDEQGKPLPFGSSGQYISYQSFTANIKPGQTINPGRVSLSAYGIKVKDIYVSIAKVILEDGSVIRIPEDELVFVDYWVFE